MTTRRHGPANALRDLPDDDRIIDGRGNAVLFGEIGQLPDDRLRTITRQIRAIATHAEGLRRQKAARWAAALGQECRRRQISADEPRRERPIAERLADARQALGLDAPAFALGDASGPDGRPAPAVPPRVPPRSPDSDPTLPARMKAARAALRGIGADDPATAERTRLARQALGLPGGR